MNKLLCILLCTILSTVLSEDNRSTVQTIDNWNTPSETLIIFLEGSESQYQDSFVLGSSGAILGTERDVRLIAQGDDNSIVSASMSSGLNVATPSQASGTLVIQYDGLDSSMVVNPVGLQTDLTKNSADGFVISASSDHPATLGITIYSDGARVSSYSLVIPPTDEMVEYTILFSQFTGNADFADVGAVVLQIEADTNVDVLVDFVGTSGPGRVYFINPPGSCEIDFVAQCYEDKSIKPPPPGIENGNSTSTETDESSDDSDESDDEDNTNIFVSVSVFVRQYFSFSWQEVEIESESESDNAHPGSPIHHHEAFQSPAGALTVSLVVLTAALMVVL